MRICPICSVPFKNLIGMSSHMAGIHQIRGKENVCQSMGLTLVDWKAELDAKKDARKLKRQKSIVADTGPLKIDSKSISEPAKQVEEKSQKVKATLKKFPKPPKEPSFYDTRQWLDLRYTVLKKYGAKCMLCGDTPSNGAIIQVDHVRPRFKYPELELDITNMQVLCRDCNMGKSYTDETDWRCANV